MSSLMAHFEHGALSSEGHLVDPRSALQRTRYECPDCHRSVHVRKGKARATHFAHNPDPANPCTYYNRNPSLDQRHRNAQLKLKQFLERLDHVDVRRVCPCGCRWMSHWEVRRFSDTVVKCEHRFRFNESNKSADVAVLDSKGDIVCIFEIVNTHYTREMDRPEPWHEIRADEVNAIPSDAKNISLTCLRQVLRPECLAKREADRLHLEERRREWEKVKEEQRIQREKEEKEREENLRKWREDFERRHREARERWYERQQMQIPQEVPAPQIERVEVVETPEQRAIREQAERENAQRLTRISEQRKERDRKQQEVEDDHVRWIEGDTRRVKLYQTNASREPSCMMCMTTTEWSRSASLGRCKGCNAEIRKKVDRQLR